MKTNFGPFIQKARRVVSRIVQIAVERRNRLQAPQLVGSAHKDVPISPIRGCPNGTSACPVDPINRCHELFRGVSKRESASSA